MRESVDGFQFTSVIQLPGSNVTQTGEQQSTAAGPAIDTNTTNRKSTQSKRGKPTTRKVQRRVPRPRNSWILYRSEKSKLLHTERPGLKAVDISSLVSEMWAFEPEEVKQYYTHLAEIEARQHREKYPEYRYTPQARATKN
uniref:Mating type protein MAT1-1-3 n=1 Tax=Cryphonectria parasitica TaxID=5116 RepID=Q96V08_CRYPA|nr:mating type protein MAT1-1-3 [Cryphonectria parasitica]